MHRFFYLGLTTIAIAIAPNTAKADEVRVQPVAPTPSPYTVNLAVSYPKPKQVVKNPVWMQFRIDGYSLGADSQFDRRDELAGSDMGQTVHIVIDNMPYFPINGPALDPFDEEGYYYDTSYKFKIHKSLSSGEHVIRAFPARSYGESLKTEKTFFVSTFYVNDTENRSNIDLSKPYLTYNEPSNHFYLVESRPVLLDFLISNCELTPDGYKVRLTVDGKAVRLLTSWQPYYIYGLKKGTHKIQLELVDKNDKVVSGPFSEHTESIQIH